MKKYILIVLLMLVVLSSCTPIQEWKGLYCTESGNCEWMTGGGSETCSLSYTHSTFPIPLLGFHGERYYLVDDTCVVHTSWMSWLW